MQTFTVSTELLFATASPLNSNNLIKPTLTNLKTGYSTPKLYLYTIKLSNHFSVCFHHNIRLS